MADKTPQPLALFAIARPTGVPTLRIWLANLGQALHPTTGSGTGPEFLSFVRDEDLQLVVNRGLGAVIQWAYPDFAVTLRAAQVTIETDVMVGHTLDIAPPTAKSGTTSVGAATFAILLAERYSLKDFVFEKLNRIEHEGGDHNEKALDIIRDLINHFAFGRTVEWLADNRKPSPRPSPSAVPGPRPSTPDEN